MASLKVENFLKKKKPPRAQIFHYFVTKVETKIKKLKLHFNGKKPTKSIFRMFFKIFFKTNYGYHQKFKKD